MNKQIVFFFFCKITGNEVFPPSESFQKTKSFFFFLHLKYVFMSWTTHCHGFFSVLPLLSNLAKYYTGINIFPAGETDFGFLSIPIVASFYLKFSCPFSWRFMLCLHLQLSILNSLWCCPSICQNFLLIAIYIAFYVFFPFMLSLLFQNTIMIITHIIKLVMLQN